MNNLVVSNLTHHPGRTAASVIGVAVGIVLVVLTVGLVRGSLRDSGQRAANIGAEIMLTPQGQGLSITAPPLTLNVSMLDEVRNVPGVATVAPVGQNLEMKGESGLGIRQVDGIDYASYTAVSSVRVVRGEPLPASGDVAIVDEVYAGGRETKLGDKLSAMDRQFTIVGIYAPEAGARIKIPLSTMQQALSAEGKCSMLLVKVQNPEEQEAVAQRIDAQFPGQFRVIFTQDLPEMFASGFSAFNVFLNLVAGLAAVISLLVILLTMYTTVTERTRQIGILKSLGLSKPKIAWVFETEALLISALGVLGGLAVALLARWALVRYAGLKIDLEPRYIAYASLAGLASGLLGALYPALRAASQDPVKALSYE
jgi:putative ABC transport system permease protein